jgi:hypothetical protein
METGLLKLLPTLYGMLRARAGGKDQARTAVSRGRGSDKAHSNHEGGDSREDDER